MRIIETGCGNAHEAFIENDVDLILYNLGYLPTTDKKITTQVESTINSIKNAIEITSKKNDYLIIIVVYPGHTEGKIESDIIDDFVYNLPSKHFLVSKYMNYNRPSSPYILTISKNK